MTGIAFDAEVPATALAQVLRNPAKQVRLWRHVVICAQKAGYAVITSDPFDLKRLDPVLQLIPV